MNALSNVSVNLDPITVTVPTATALTGLSRSVLYREIQAERLEVKKWGRTTLITYASLVALISSLPDGVGDRPANTARIEKITILAALADKGIAA